MNLRKLAAAAAVVTAFGLPAVAQATEPVVCNGTTRDTTGEPTDVTRVGVCQSGLGYVEIGVQTAGGVPTGRFYVVLSGDDSGYVGLSNYESTPDDGDQHPCEKATPDGSEGGSGTNYGGCYGLNGEGQQVDLSPYREVTVGNTTVAVPLPVCGDNTGAFYNSSRNGCRVDNEDVAQALTQVTDFATCVIAHLNTTDIVNVAECVQP